MAALLVVLGLVVAGVLAVGVLVAIRVGQNHVSALSQAGRAAVQVKALRTSLAITRTQYDAERALWEAALDETPEPQR